MVKKFQATDNIAFIYEDNEIDIRYENGNEPIFTDSISYLNVLQLKEDIDKWLKAYWERDKRNA